MANQMASGLFRSIAAIGRTELIAGTIGSFILVVLVILGGFIVSRGNLNIYMHRFSIPSIVFHT